MSKLEIELAEKQNAISSSGSWFYWIAGMSIINSLILFIDGDWSFIIGLGITQIIDALIYEASMTFKVIGFVIDLIIAAFFVLIGFFVVNRWSKIALAIGMILYALDGLIFFFFEDWLSFGFHIFALFMISAAIGNINSATELVKTLEQNIDEE